MLPELGLGEAEAAAVVEQGDRMIAQSSRQVDADCGALLLHVSVLCLPRHICSPASSPMSSRLVVALARCLPFAVCDEGQGIEKISHGKTQEIATARLLTRCVDEVRVVIRQARAQRESHHSPIGFAHSRLVLLRRLLSCVPASGFSVGGAGWRKILRDALLQTRECVTVARVVLDDAYVCSGGMGEDEDDAEISEEYRQEEGEEGGEDGTSLMKSSQRACWLTLREAVLFLSELSVLELSERVSASECSDSQHGIMTDVDYEMVGDTILSVMFTSQHNGLVEQAAGALRAVAVALGGDHQLLSKWLREVLSKVFDDTVAVSRKSSQVSLALTSLLAADCREHALCEESLSCLLTAALGEGARDGNCTRVRALMSIRFILLDGVSGKTAMRIHGDDMLVCILKALQSDSWTERNAANLALGAAVERCVGRDKTRQPRASQFFRSYPNFAHALLTLLEGGEGSALLPALCFLARLSPFDDTEEEALDGLEMAEHAKSKAHARYMSMKMVQQMSPLHRHN